VNENDASSAWRGKPATGVLFLLAFAATWLLVLTGFTVIAWRFS
jgi:hypothetical protein